MYYLLNAIYGMEWLVLYREIVVFLSGFSNHSVVRLVAVENLNWLYPLFGDYL